MKICEKLQFTKILFVFMTMVGAIMLNSTVSRAEEMKQYNLTTSTQTIQTEKSVQMNFTMKKSGFVTIICDGPVEYSIYAKNGSCIYESGTSVNEASDYSLTYPLNAGDYYAVLKSYNSSAKINGIYTMKVRGIFEYKIPSLSTKKKIYYGVYNIPYYTKVVVKKAGYITIDTTYPHPYSAPYLSLCNKNKKDISNSTWAGDTNKYVFAVTKGTYYIKAVPQANCKYTLKYKFTACSDKKGKPLKGGSSKKKAKSIKVGKSVSGLVLISDKNSSKQWYKIVSNKTRIVKINLSASVSASSSTLRGQSMQILISGPYGQADTFTSRAGFKDSVTIGVGTEPTYICIIKKGKTTSGNYKITVKK